MPHASAATPTTLGSILTSDLVSPYQRSREKAMADSPVFVPSGAAVPTSPTPSESRAASPDGVETDPAQHCRDRDITEIDGEALGQSAQLSMAAAPVNWAGSIDSGRGQSSPMRGQQVQATSSLHSGAASASCAVSTRSAAEHGVPAERPSQPALELTELVLAARARELFPADATWPVGRRMPRLADTVSKKLVLWAHSIVYGWPDEYVRNLSSTSLAMSFEFGNDLGLPRCVRLEMRTRMCIFLGKQVVVAIAVDR